MGKEEATEDSETLTVMVYIPGTAVKPLGLGAELTKLICAWLCRNFFQLFFFNFFSPLFSYSFLKLTFPYCFSSNGFVIY